MCKARDVTGLTLAHTYVALVPGFRLTVYILRDKNAEHGLESTQSKIKSLVLYRNWCCVKLRDCLYRI